MLNQDFKEFIALLNHHKVQYLVIGGYALALHGHPRYTKDIDIWVDIGEKNAERIIQVLSDFGFASVAVDKNDFLSSGNIVQLGFPPNRIDILTSADGIVFSECIQNAQIVNLDGTEVRFIDVANLIKNKQTSGRLQDLADVEAIQKVLEENAKSEK